MLRQAWAGRFWRGTARLGRDKFRGLWESTDGLIQVDYGSRIGLGSREYRLIEV